MSVTRRTVNKLMFATAALGCARVNRSDASQSLSPEIMFIQSQNLPWYAVNDWGSGALQRIVSVGLDGDPRTYVLKLPPAFVGAIPPNKAGQFLVVSGSVSIDGHTLEHQALAQFQQETAGIEAPGGASLIVFDGERRLSAPIPEGGHGTFEVVTPWLINWAHRTDFNWPLSSTFVDESENQLGRPEIPTVVRSFWKSLDTVSDVPGRTMLWAGLPAQTDPDQRRFQPTCDLELFVLQGDITDSQVGTMIQGAYAKLSKGHAYGPWSTANGFVALVKTDKAPGIVRLNEGDAETDPQHREPERIPPHLRPFAEVLEPPNWWTLPTTHSKGERG